MNATRLKFGQFSVHIDSKIPDFVDVHATKWFYFEKTNYTGEKFQDNVCSKAAFCFQCRLDFCRFLGSGLCSSPSSERGPLSRTTAGLLSVHASDTCLQYSKTDTGSRRL